MFRLDTAESIGVENVNDAGALRFYGGGTRPCADQSHFADGGLRAQAAHPQLSPVMRPHDDAHSSAQQEMHGLGRLALAGNDFAGSDFKSTAISSQDVGMRDVAKHVRQPLAQRP